MTLRAVAVSLALACTVAPALAQTAVDWAPMANPDPRLAAMRQGAGARLRAPGQVAISPDGSTLAWTIGGREGQALHLTDLANPDPAKDKIVSVAGTTNCSNGAPVWSPDSQTLAFTSTCTSKDEKPGQPQIFLYSRSSGEAKQLTHLKGIFQQAAWSPDGKSIAFLFVENASRSAGALAAMKPWSGVIGEDGVEVQRVYAVDVASGRANWLTPLTLHVYEFDWAPGAREIAYIAADLPGENNWWVAQLYAAPVHLGPNDVSAQPRSVFDPGKSSTAMKGLQMAVPRFSPDGKKIAFIGGLMSDQGSTGGDIWVVNADGKGQPTDITPEHRRHPHLPLLDRSLTISASSKTAAATRCWPTTSSAPGSQDATSGPGRDDGLRRTDQERNRRLVAWCACLREVRPRHTARALGRAVQRGEADYSPERRRQKPHPHRVRRVGEQRRRHGGEVFHVQGWLTYPKDYDAKKKYPLIVEVHGGPSASAGARWGQNTWAELGYFVFAPNPRGSFGQGEKFTAANMKDFGYGDLRDITSGMDAVEKKVSIDKNREGLTGWSYGGFMTMFGVTQTTRFRAAVAGAGISDWQSYYGENSIDQWMVPFFGATVYDDPAVYAKSSAINFIKKVKTPTLVIVGDRDGECPAPQSFEFWHALRAEGVPTQLVIYPNEGHGFRDPAHIADREAREVAWFEKYMPAK